MSGPLYRKKNSLGTYKWHVQSPVMDKGELAQLFSPPRGCCNASTSLMPALLSLLLKRAKCALPQVSNLSTVCRPQRRSNAAKNAGANSQELRYWRRESMSAHPLTPDRSHDASSVTRMTQSCWRIFRISAISAADRN